MVTENSEPVVESDQNDVFVHEIVRAEFPWQGVLVLEYSSVNEYHHWERVIRHLLEQGRSTNILFCEDLIPVQKFSFLCWSLILLRFT